MLDEKGQKPTDEAQQDAVAPDSTTPAPAPTEPENAPQGPSELPNVHQAIAEAMRQMRAVGKWGQNKQDGYAFKRIDDFMTAAHGGLSAAGVHIVPRVLQRLTDDSHTTSRGNVLRWIDLEVAFDFHGPAGDKVTVVTWGEGRDASDKATNKALTAAMKYALMYALMVPTEDIQDADRESPEANTQQGPTEAQQREHAERQEREAAARAEERARLIATATAAPEVVDELRTAVLLYADTIHDVVTRKEHLLATWSEAARAGALGCTVLIPEPWQPLAQQTETTLHDLIVGAQGAGLPDTGESDTSTEAEKDPWATEPAGDTEQAGASE
jgi:hypothetical protein